MITPDTVRILAEEIDGDDKLTNAEIHTITMVYDGGHGHTEVTVQGTVDDDATGVGFSDVERKFEVRR